MKFEKENENIVLNEFLSLKLAQYVGIDIPNIEILKFDGEQVLKVERFDRKIISDEKIERLHIIDMCQVNCVPVSYKYERPYGNNASTKDIRDGISFQKVFSATAFCKIPVLDKRKIIDWVIVNLCLGNCDAHGKNISFFVDKKGKLKLTPFYDIVNIQLYKATYAQDLAMGFYDEFIIEDLKAYDFIEFCNDNNIKVKVFHDRFLVIANKLTTYIHTLNLNDFQTDIDTSKNNIFFDSYKIDCISRISLLLKNIKLMKGT